MKRNRALLLIPILLAVGALATYRALAVQMGDRVRASQILASVESTQLHERVQEIQGAARKQPGGPR